jgi:hypothetical protein
MVGAAAALLLLLVWYLLRTEEVLETPQRTLNNVELKWKCAAGHVFYATGHSLDSGGLTAPKTCVSCGQPAYPFAPYTCPVHGPFEVAVQFAVDKDGALDVSQVRLPGRDWLPKAQGLRCPRCDRPLVYVDDPLEGVGAGKRRGGG